ncbi:MAG TPA: tryptophan--tRNA ligase, partial [Enteractinococcus sp.]
DQTVEELVTAYEGKMYGHLKVDLAEAVTERLAPIRKRALELLDDPAELDQILAKGAQKARSIAAPVLDEVYKKSGFLPLAR